MNISQFNKVPTLQDVDVTNKRCVVRVDFNVPIKDGKITDLARIYAVKPTIDYLLKAHAKVVLLSHLSRIKSVDDIKKGKKSLLIVAKALKQIYPKYHIIFVKDSTDKRLPSLVKSLKHNQMILLENTRYKDVDLKTKKEVKLESKNSPKLARFWASLCDVFVNDAFATIHRAHASNAGIAKLAKKKCVGFLIERELENIARFDKYSTKPAIAIVGGAKIADKIGLLETLLESSDQVLIGGGMANTFLSALGVNMGKSLVETEMKRFAKSLYNKHKEKIILPIDFVVAKDVKDQKCTVVPLNKIPNNMMALDIGPKTIAQFNKVIKYAKTIFWNGTPGVCEYKNFVVGTREIAGSIAKATLDNAFSLIGGGDTAGAAVKAAGKNSFSFVSTGGGATLAAIAGESLPGLFSK